MNAHLVIEALKLSPGDRLQLIAALSETLSEEDIPVISEERALLDARLADLDANPGNQSPWPDVRARLQQRPR
jgi:putative addiction module component (TIGR02574 family)